MHHRFILFFEKSGTMYQQHDKAYIYFLSNLTTSMNQFIYQIFCGNHNLSKISQDKIRHNP